MKARNRDLFYKTKRERKSQNAARREASRREASKRKHRKKQRSSNFSAIPHKQMQQEVFLPEQIGLGDSLSSMAKVCEKIRASGSKALKLNFQNVEKIYSDGMLWLYAEVFRKISIFPDSKITCQQPPNRKENKVLQHIGFYDMIKKDSRIPTDQINEEDILPWRVVKGIEFDGKQLNKFLNALNINKNINQENDPLYISIMEMIANAIEHAYQQKQYKHWLLFGRLSDDKSRVSIVIGDLGKTIPTTMRTFIEREVKKDKKKTRFKISRIMRYMRDDNNLIKMAVSDETSKFGYSRGNGLREAFEKIVELGGQLIIYSRDGLANLDKNSKKYGSLKNRVNGTIICIDVPVQIK